MAVASVIDTVEGTINGSLWFHFDLSNDVLYLRLASTRSEPTYGEETPEGFTLLRTEDGSVAGMTVVNYWRHFGSGNLEETSLQELRNRVAEWTQTHVSAA